MDDIRAEKSASTAICIPTGPSIEADAFAQSGMNITRRALCSLGVGLSAAVMLGVGAPPGPGSGDQDIRYVVTDRRYRESLEFGAILARRGSKRLEVTEGLTRLWREALVPLWREEGAAIAGLTRYSTWACIAEQARSCARRSVLVGRHVLDEEGAARGHVLSASLPMQAGTSALGTSDGTWPRAMAELVAAQAPNDSRTTAVKRLGNTAATGLDPSFSLASWIIG